MAVPVEWLGNFQVNTGAAATGDQSEPKIIGLANGNILVAWTEAENGGGSDGLGANIVGRLYSPEGRPLGAAFELEGGVVDVTAFDIAATNDGGFYLVYTAKFDVGGEFDYSLGRRRFDAEGDSIGATLGGAPEEMYDNPTITVDQFTNTALIAYEVLPGAGGGDIQAFVLYDDGSQSDNFGLAQNTADVDRAPEVATLSNGSFVLVYEESDFGLDGIEFSIVALNTPVQNFLLDADDNAFNPRVAALVGGGFVMAFQTNTENGNIVFRIYDNDGNPGASFSVGFGSDAQVNPTVVALPDGDFVVTWRNISDDTLEGFRLNATGSSDGGPFVIEDFGTTTPEIGVTGDGRLLFTWLDGNAEVRASIWDPRISTIDALDYFSNRNFVEGDVVTAGVGDTRINCQGVHGLVARGQAGDDTITGDSNLQVMYGGGGNDSLQGGFGPNPTAGFGDLLDGEAGNDTIVGTHGADTISGGKGADRIRTGKGKDRVEFDTLINGAGDRITDFDPAKDRIELDKNTFDLPRGALQPGRFVLGATAQDAGDRIIYNAANGRLWFDPDGTGAEAKVLLATFTNTPNLSAADFIVI